MQQAVPQGPDSVEPVFFLSYARARPVIGDEERDPDAAVLRLFFDLSAHLNQLVYRDAALPPGALDRLIEGGRWSPRLAESVGTCHVFVALASPHYYRSMWCGREWGAFEARLRGENGEPLARETGIVVVRWVPPAPGQHLPRVVSAVQEFAPTDSREYALYREHGLWGLLAGGDEDTYKYIVYRLARRIAALFYALKVPPLVIKEATDLPNVFREEP